MSTTVWIYVDASKQVGNKDHLKVFASEDAAGRSLPPRDCSPTGDNQPWSMWPTSTKLATKVSANLHRVYVRFAHARLGRHCLNRNVVAARKRLIKYPSLLIIVRFQLIAG
jgi:hypothetical protein